ncbi:MAG: nucleoside hydrolase [Truepera sp.]|nr:nucleoside hydrolase [Truepera sp.]
MPRPRLILDCDPGHDDAIAILMAAKHGELLAITAVSGNAPLRLTAHNALITTQILGLDTPVYAGAERPLVAPPRHAEFIHGKSGLGGPILPPLTRQLAGHDAVRFIIEAGRRYDDLWVVATGPLTNIALALRQAPDLAARLRGIAIMGGSTSFGNVTSHAEFNIWADPEAAAIVFASGATLLLCGLNLTHQFMISPDTVAQLRALGGVAATFTAELLDFYCAKYAEKFFGKVEGPLHDPCAVMLVTHPELFTCHDRPVAVELTGQLTRGMTVVDERGVKAMEPNNTSVAYGLDAPAALELLLETVQLYA